MTEAEFGEWAGRHGWSTWDGVREALEAAYDCDWRERLYRRFPAYPVRSVDGQRHMPADHFASVSADIRTAVQLDRDNEFCEMFDGGWEGVE